MSLNGIELQDCEFIAAIREGQEPNGTVARFLPVMQTLDRQGECIRALSRSAWPASSGTDPAFRLETRL